MTFKRDSGKAFPSLISLAMAADAFLLQRECQRATLFEVEIKNSTRHARRLSSWRVSLSRNSVMQRS
jgi:hypothetical protein